MDLTATAFHSHDKLNMVTFIYYINLLRPFSEIQLAGSSELGKLFDRRRNHG